MIILKPVKPLTPQQVNYKSDFEIAFRLYDMNGKVLPLPSCDWAMNIWTTAYKNAVTVSRVEGEFLNARYDGDQIIVVVNNHKLTPGSLKIEFFLHLPHEFAEDKILTQVIPKDMDIELVDGPSNYGNKLLGNLVVPGIGGASGNIDLSNYATKDDLQQAIEALELPPLKTINGEEIVGEGDIHIEGGGNGLTDWQENFLKQQEEAERESKFSASLSISPVSNEFTGESVALTVTANAKYDGQAVQVEVTPTSSSAASLVFTNGKTEAIWLPPTISQGSVNISYTVNVTYNDGYGDLTKSVSASQTRYAPIRFVCKPGIDTPTSEEIKGGIKYVKSSPVGDYSIPFTVGDYIWLCFPAFMSPKSFTSGGFGVPVETAQTAICTIGSTDVSYKCIRISGAPKTSPMTIKIS